MTPGLMAGLAGFAALLALLAFGVPVALAMGAVAIVGLWTTIGSTFLLSTVQSLPYSFASDYNFVVVPMFVLMGAIAARANIIADLYTAAYRLTSGVRGSLMMATVIAQALFAAVSGSTTVAASVFTRMALPEMLRFRYDPGVAAGSVAAAGTLAGLIPPSIAMVLYAILTGEPIGSLLIAGIVPGALTVVAYLVGIRLMLVLRPEWAPVSKDRFDWSQKLSALGSTWSILLLIAIVLGGIYGGVFPPSAAGAIGAAGALAIALGMRRLKRGDLWDSLLESARVSAVIFIIVMAGLMFSRFLVVSGFIEAFRTLIVDSNIGVWGFLAITTAIFVVLGMFVDSVSLMVLTLPFLHPIAKALGIDGVWFGVLVVKLIEIAAISPPVGLNLFAVLAASRKQVTAMQLYRGVIPFLLMDAVVLALLLAFPGLSTWLPELMG
jgi:tripartite ATP-independent transporter DctM subunit